MNSTASLRLRLTLIILLPLLLLAMVLGVWQLIEARRTASEVFDRSLLSAALAVANDVALSEGDALSDRTRNILTSTSGGTMFYHVYAPDGVIVAGYARPPVGIPPPSVEVGAPTYFTATYLGREVIGVRVRNRTEIDDFAGIFTTTVWQDSTVRSGFSQGLITRALLSIVGMMLLVALTVWFGVRLGLRPLLSLEDAIDRRSPDDLSAIRRAVPDEVTGIVSTLNRLLGQMQRTMRAQSDFIANAAHQLRNPIAGVLSLAEAVKSAPNDVAMRERAEALVDAARETAALSHKLLLLERADALSGELNFLPFDLSQLVDELCGRQHGQVPGAVAFDWAVVDHPLTVSGDETMVREAVTNLIDNALRHGGVELSELAVNLTASDGEALVAVRDNGAGKDLSQAALARATERFAKAPSSSSTGLGLSIVRSVAEGHGGALELASDGETFTATLRFPLST